METLHIEILNPKASKLLKDLAELNLISIHKKLRGDAAKIPAKSGKKQIDNYPFRPQYLKFNETNYILREKLDATVSFEDGNYSINNQLLDITVWGKTRDEAEEAFAFAFHSLFENFAREQDSNLTPHAQILKQTLQHLVFNIVKNNEGKKD